MPATPSENSKKGANLTYQKRFVTKVSECADHLTIVFMAVTMTERAVRTEQIAYSLLQLLGFRKAAIGDPVPNQLVI